MRSMLMSSFCVWMVAVIGCGPDPSQIEVPHGNTANEGTGGTSGDSIETDSNTTGNSTIGTTSDSSSSSISSTGSTSSTGTTSSTSTTSTSSTGTTSSSSTTSNTTTSSTTNTGTNTQDEPYDWLGNGLESTLGDEVLLPIPTFSTDLFLKPEGLDGSLSCYGPTVPYQNHPDGSDGPTDGFSQYPYLPSGDVGIWTELEPSTGEACAGAVFRNRLARVRNQIDMVNISIAVTVAAAENGGKSLPAAGESWDATNEMNQLGVQNVTFTNATLSHLNETDWAYSLAFTYIAAGNEYDAELWFYNSLYDADHYSGTIGYRVEAGSAVLIGNNCLTDTRLKAGSLRYVKEGNSLNYQSRSAQWCGESMGLEFIADVNSPAVGQVDFANRYDPNSNPNGWTDHANLFVASFDPSNLNGRFSSSWQAGFHDFNSRAINTQLSGVPAEGQAFYGYADPIYISDGTVAGFICNWAGPGATHAMYEMAQRQWIRKRETSPLFDSLGVNIQYAPVNSCSYDGGGNFVFDTDIDKELTDEVGGAVSNSLFSASTEGTNSVAEAIAKYASLPDVAVVGGWPGEN